MKTTQQLSELELDVLSFEELQELRKIEQEMKNGSFSSFNEVFHD